MCLLRATIFFFLINLPHYIWAQSDSSISNYIERYNKTFNLKLSANNNSETFKVNSGPVDIKIRSNSDVKTKLTFAYRFISFSVAVAPNFIPGNDDEHLKGDSRVLRLGVNLNPGRFIQHLSYEKINRFYLENTDDINPNWVEGDPYFKFPDLTYRGISGYTGYRINPKFSVRALSVQTERQVKSAGSIIPMLTYRYYKFDDRTPIVPGRSSQKSHNYQLHALLGYFYTFVLREKWYVSGGALVGGGFIKTDLETRFFQNSINSSINSPSFMYKLDGAIGYNSERFFSGFQIQTTFQEFRQDNTANTIEDRKIIYQVFVGYRFNAIKKVDEWFDKMNFL